jgi:hypothetical protein
MNNSQLSLRFADSANVRRGRDARCWHPQHPSSVSNLGSDKKIAHGRVIGREHGRALRSDVWIT